MMLFVAVVLVAVVVEYIVFLKANKKDLKCADIFICIFSLKKY